MQGRKRLLEVMLWAGALGTWVCFAASLLGGLPRQVISGALVAALLLSIGASVRLEHRRRNRDK
jgi:hypothetical protein